MYQHLYKQFLAARPNVQHFACHSHHYWPDVTRQAMLDYWDDTANMVDEKWEYIFANKLPATQKLIAKALNLTSSERIVFAPNTHELLYRIYSSFDPNKKIKILTTDSEFYSFQRQSERLEQADLVEITRVATEPFATFEQRFTAEANEGDYDWIFVSQVFFNSGYAINNLTDFVKKLPTKPLITIDGYHGFFAIPTDLSELEQQVFYLAGSYKYAQGGEGACFAVVPDGDYQPIYTGWFAEFGDLHQRQEGHVGYAKNGQQFAGATIDYTAMYRLHASLTLFEQEGLSVEVIHQYVENCQQAFLMHIDKLNHPLLNRSNLLSPNNAHGHFLTFKLVEDDVVELAQKLDTHGIKTDFRGDRLRFGFAIYHNPQHYDLTCLAQD
jgi:selenocysteine lyase/cysteine desulfurase